MLLRGAEGRSGLPPDVWLKIFLESQAQTGIKVARRNINNYRYADDNSLMAESEEDLKSLLMKGKENEKVGLKTAFRKLRSWRLVPSLQGK